MRFVAVIIGSELLDGRRGDAHFGFLRQALFERGHTLDAAWYVADKPDLIESLFTLAATDEQMVLFSFGGIGATPDDYTRQCAANVFTASKLALHSGGMAHIEARFENPTAYQREMVNFPNGAGLLHNPVNQIPGFSLFDRLFFVPGFPSMAHPMVIEALERFVPTASLPLRHTLLAECSEGALMEMMNALPQGVTLSCLPESSGLKRQTTLSLSAHNGPLLDDAFAQIQIGLDAAGIGYEIVEGV